MKKLLLSLGAMLISGWAFTANAVDYYLIGGFNNWTLSDSKAKFTNQNDGTYVLDYNGVLTSGFKINDGTWSNDQANWGAGDGALTVGQTYTMTLSGTSGNIDIKDGINVTNPHLVFNPAANTLLITGSEEKAELIYGIHGTWYDSAWSTTNLTEQNGKWVLSKRDIPAGQFGIKVMDKSTGAQTSWISADGDNVIVPNTDMKCKVEGTNFQNAAGNYEVVFDPEAMTLTFNGTQTGENPSINPYADWWVNVMGEFNWTTDGNGAQPDPETNIATIEGMEIGDTGFKIKIWNGSTDIYYIAENSPIAVGSWVKFIEDTTDAPSTMIEGATPTSVYNVQYNVETNEVKLTTDNGEVTPPTPLTLYVVGSSVNGMETWNVASADNAMTYNAEMNTYTWSGKQLSKEFKINNGAWNTGYNIGVAEATTIEIGKAVAAVNNSDSQNLSVPADNEVVNPVVVLDMTANTITVTGTLQSTAPFVPTTITLKGSFDEWGNGVAMKLENGVWEALVEVEAAENVQFKLDCGDGNWYGAPKGSENVTFTKDIAVLTVAMPGENWSIFNWEGGSIGATLNWDKKELTLVANPQLPENPSGVAGLESENGETVIYTLQGVRVEKSNLTPGLYIINGKKVMVK